jgi:protein-S-isoprenylcysteine O-methyltransferase Ste14
MASTRRSIVASVLFTVFGGPAILLVLVPWFVTHFQVPAHLPPWHSWAGGLLIALGLIPAFESIVRFIVVGRGSLVPAVPTEHLVVSGLYRFVRNPMYVGVLTAIAGEALLFWRAGLVIELIAAWVSFHLFVRFYEEPKLTRTFGAEYKRYREHVPRWVPRLRAWRRDPAEN